MPTTDDKGEVMLAPEVARLLRISPRSLAGMRDVLKPFRTGPKSRLLRYRRADVEQYLDRQHSAMQSQPAA